MNKKIISIILVIISIFVLTGCDNRKCIKSHTESKVVPVTVIINKRPIVVMRTQVTTICDEYENSGGNKDDK